MSNEYREKRPKTRWGRWRWNKRKDTLDFWYDGENEPRYWIELDSARYSSAECLDWIFQVSRKGWMTNEDRGNMLQAIQNVINPQVNLCSWGIERGQTGTKETSCDKRGFEEIPAAQDKNPGPEAA
jgi:hypothetical protein